MISLGAITSSILNAQNLIRFATILITVTYSAGLIAKTNFQSAVIQYEIAALEKIPFPDHTSDFETSVRCSALALPNGRIVVIDCRANDKLFPQISRSVLKHAKEFTVTPASVNGKPVCVLLKFTVGLIKKENERQISIVQNYALTTKISAATYYGPQRITLSRKERLAAQRSIKHCPYGIAVVVVSEIDSLGNVTNVELSDNDFNKKCSAGIKQLAFQYKYIPAFPEGYLTGSITADIFKRTKSSLLFF